MPARIVQNSAALRKFYKQNCNLAQFITTLNDIFRYSTQRNLQLIRESSALVILFPSTVKGIIEWEIVIWDRETIVTVSQLPRYPWVHQRLMVRVRRREEWRDLMLTLSAQVTLWYILWLTYEVDNSWIWLFKNNLFLDSCDCDEFGLPLAKKINRMNIEQSASAEFSSNDSGGGSDFNSKYPFPENSPYFQNNLLLSKLYLARVNRNPHLKHEPN